MLMHRLAFLAFIIGGFPLHCVQRTMSFFKGRSKMDRVVLVEEWTLRGYEAFILLPVLVHIHSLALHCYRWRGFEYKCSSWYPDRNGFWRPLVALAASSARAPARMPQGM